MPMSCDVIHVCLFVNRAYSMDYRWYSAQIAPLLLLFSYPSVILFPVPLLGLWQQTPYRFSNTRLQLKIVWFLCQRTSGKSEIQRR